MKASMLFEVANTVACSFEKEQDAKLKTELENAYRACSERAGQGFFYCDYDLPNSDFDGKGAIARMILGERLSEEGYAIDDDFEFTSEALRITWGDVDPEEF